MPVYSIYCLTNHANGMQYIGQTKQKPEHRWRDHVKFALAYRSGCRYLSRAIRKHGKESFEFRILEQVHTREQANEREALWITSLSTLSPNGYNLKSGGMVAEFSEETKKRMGGPKGEKNPRYHVPISDEWRRNISLGRTGLKRAPFSEEWRRRIGDAQKGRKRSPEFCEKIRQAKLGKPRPAEVIEKLRQANLGKKLSPETRQRMSEAHFARHRP